MAASGDANPREKLVIAGAERSPPAPCVKINDSGGDDGERSWLRRQGIGFIPFPEAGMVNGVSFGRSDDVVVADVASLLAEIVLETVLDLAESLFLALLETSSRAGFDGAASVATVSPVLPFVARVERLVGGIVDSKRTRRQSMARILFNSFSQAREEVWQIDAQYENWGALIEQSVLEQSPRAGYWWRTSRAYADVS